jgi:signal transduction histidine kinase
MPETRPILHYLCPLPGDGVAFAPEELAILDLINGQVAAAPSLGDLMDFLFEEVRELYPCDRIGLAFLEDEGQRATSHWNRSVHGEVLLGKGYSEDLSRSSLRGVLESGAPRIIYDLSAYLEEHPRSHSTRLLVAEGVRSSLTCVLTSMDRPFALLFLSSRSPHSYTPYHVRLWRAIAERLSQAVEKAWRIEQLQAANQAYAEMLGFVSHELKNPVASMITDARVLTGGYLGPLEPRQMAKLEGLVRKGEYLLDLVREYLDLARMEGGDLRLNPREVQPVADILDPALELVLPQLAARGQRLERVHAPTEAVIQCDPVLLRIVVVNLVGNAVKYGHPGGLVRVTFTHGPGEFRLSVFNEGPGFPAEERPRLFRKFSRLQSPDLVSRKGTGVGLYTAWRIVRLHGGRIDATSVQGESAEFTVEIPQPLT